MKRLFILFPMFFCIYGYVGQGNAVSSTGVSSIGNVSTANISSVQIDPSTGSVGLSIPVSVPQGRGGIQPDIQVVYNSFNRQLGNAGVGWALDIGSIQLSTKKGIPKYNGTDLYMFEKDNSSQYLVYDSQVGFYRFEIEGQFARIQQESNGWLMTDKKGIKYYYGNTPDSIQADPANPTHIFRWALNKVEDINGNYMTISYINDQGQIYPSVINYTGNDIIQPAQSPYAQVNFNYVLATTPSQSYISGFRIVTGQRIDNIKIYAGSNIQSTYTFSYKQSSYTYRDLLQAVQITGADGNSTLPASKFSYTENGAAKGFVLDTNQNDYIDLPYFAGAYSNNPNGGGIFNPGLWDYGVRQVNPYNGADWSFVILTTPCTSSTGNWMAATNNCGAYSVDNGVRLMDLDGDGQVDIIQNVKNVDGTFTKNAALMQTITSGLNAGEKGWVDNNNWVMPDNTDFVHTVNSGTSTVSCPSYAVNIWCFPVQSSTLTVQSGTTFADVDGAGYSDIVRSTQSNGGSYAVYLNNKEIGTTGWTLSSQWVPPNDPGTDIAAGATLIDLNGDGLADFVSVNMNGNNFIIKVFMNNGSGWSETGDYESTFNLGNSTPAVPQFVDINGDGLPDLVITQGSTAHVFINTGHGWVQDDSWAPNGANFSNLSTQFIDFNQDGLMDYVVSYQNQTPSIYLNAGQQADLLNHVNNGIGGTTDLVYEPANQASEIYQSEYVLPMNFPVVVSRTISNSSGWSSTYNYTYDNGVWDPVYREFDGFQYVDIFDQNNNETTYTFLTDHYGKGDIADEFTLNATFVGPASWIYETKNTWQTQNITTNNSTNQTSNFLYMSRTDNLYQSPEFDSNYNIIPAKYTAQEFVYGENPQYGDATQVINDGELSSIGGNSIDSNKTITNTTYVNNTNNWIIGLPSTVVTTNTNGNQVSKTSFYYDGDPTGSAIPILGRLTAKVNWLGSSTQPDPKTTYTYDIYGNLQKTTDPNLNTTTISYDNTVHIFPEQTINALNQKVTMTYYGIDSTPLNNNQGLQGLWGQESSKTDANNQIVYTTYDVFGRPLTSISPLDSVALPTDLKIYNIQSDYIAVTDIARVANGSTATISTVSYYDGLGHLIETKSIGPTAGQYIVSGQTVYDNRGLSKTKYLPYFTSNDLNTMDPINTSLPSSQFTYDSMGRVLTKINPDGTYSSIAYSQWTTTTIDENGHMQQSTVDAFGRLVQKQEYRGAASPYTLYATTSYSYDPKGNLISVMDSHNNQSTITYDNLNRKTVMNDPDMGKWQYGYDGNGNLIWQEDANGQVISFTYDALNRLINKTDAVTGPIVNLPNLPLQAATFNVNYNFDDKTQSFGIGHLGSVNYDTGTVGFVYDQMGREVASTKNIGGGNYGVVRQFDALSRLQQLQYPDGSKVAYTFNQAGQVSGVQDAN